MFFDKSFFFPERTEKVSVISVSRVFYAGFYHTVRDLFEPLFVVIGKQTVIFDQIADLARKIVPREIDVQFRVAAFIVFRQPYPVCIVPSVILACCPYSIDVFLFKKFCKRNDFCGLTVLVQNPLLTVRIVILYHKVNKFILFPLLFGILPLFFCLFRFIPLFVVLLFLCGEVFILIDKIGDTHGCFVPFQVYADIVFGVLSVRPFHADAFAAMVLTLLPVTVPADSVFVF